METFRNVPLLALFSYCAVSTFLFFLSTIRNVYKISHRKYNKLLQSDSDKGEFPVNQLQLGFSLISNFVAFSVINGGNLSTLKNHIISVYSGMLSHTVVTSTPCHCRSQTA